MKRMITCSTDNVEPININITFSGNFETGQEKKYIDEYIVATPAEEGFNPKKWKYVMSFDNYDDAVEELNKFRRNNSTGNVITYEIFSLQLEYSYSITGRM